jgi:hypothetical protein
MHGCINHEYTQSVYNALQNINKVKIYRLINIQYVNIIYIKSNIVQER